MLKREIEPLTHTLLTEMFDYQEKTGLFIRKITTNPRAMKGSIAGSPHGSGYLRVTINYKNYLLHRLAWFYVYKEWPNVIDHINGDRKDNRIDNLRSTTHRINSFNRHNYKGFKGVHWCNRSKRYIAKIQDGKYKTYIGAFKCPIEAENAYLEAKKIRNKDL